MNKLLHKREMIIYTPEKWSGRGSIKGFRRNSLANTATDGKSYNMTHYNLDMNIKEIEQLTKQVKRKTDRRKK